MRRRLWRPGAGPGASGAAQRTVLPPPATRGGGKEGRTDGPAGPTSSPRGPARLLTTSLPAVLAAAASSCCAQGPTGLSGLSATQPPAPGRVSAASAASRPLPRAGGGTALAPRSPRPVPHPHPPRSQLCRRDRLTRAALTRERAPSALRAAGGGGGSSGLQGHPGRRCSAERELEAGGGGR